MGTNLLFVSPGSRSRGGVHSGSGGWNTLKAEDATAIGQQCDAVKYTSPSASTRAQVVYGNKNWNTSIQGTGAMYPEVRNWELEEGTYFDEGHVRVAAKVCVLGSEVKKRLFEDEDAIGKIIRVKAIPFRVIGVFKSKGESGGWFNRDDMMTVPYTTVMQRLPGQEYISSIDLSAGSGARTQGD